MSLLKFRQGYRVVAGFCSSEYVDLIWSGLILSSYEMTPPQKCFGVDCSIKNAIFLFHPSVFDWGWRFSSHTGQ